jgi:hypothetical protein
MLVLKKFYVFAKVNINVDTTFQGNNFWENAGQRVRGWGVRGNLKEVRRATISVDVSNHLDFDINNLFAAVFLSVDVNIFWAQKPC